MSNGIPRPTSLLQPTRAAPEPTPASPVPMQGQPGPQDMQAMMALLMMLMMQGGMGQGAAPLPEQGVPHGPQV